MACACSPSYCGGWGRRISWTWEVEVEVSRDSATALQPGDRARLCLKKKKKKKFSLFVWHFLRCELRSSKGTIFVIFSVVLFFWKECICCICQAQLMHYIGLLVNMLIMFSFSILFAFCLVFYFWFFFCSCQFFAYVWRLVKLLWRMFLVTITVYLPFSLLCLTAT